MWIVLSAKRRPDQDVCFEALHWNFGTVMSPWLENNWIIHTQLMLDSYSRLLGRELIERSGDELDEAKRLFEAPFVVVSHGTQADPILSYGNATALALWELSIPGLLVTPSQKTAEPVHREERARLLDRTSRDGYVDNYRGIRIATSGRRFLIEQAIVWNLFDQRGDHLGQAATFSEWKFLDDACK